LNAVFAERVTAVASTEADAEVAWKPPGGVLEPFSLPPPAPSSL
jgi:hypothetical protein